MRRTSAVLVVWSMFAATTIALIVTYSRLPPERLYNVVHWSRFDRGGHFAALEEPALFVDDVRAFFRLVR